MYGSIVAAYGLLSAISIVMMLTDKRRAERGARRIPEATLHWIELMGGWPGSLLAQRVFHHKTRKTRYQVIFWLAVVANVTVVGLLIGWKARIIG